jgi:hypothetical protein
MKKITIIVEDNQIGAVLQAVAEMGSVDGLHIEPLDSNPSRRRAKAKGVASEHTPAPATVNASQNMLAALEAMKKDFPKGKPFTAAEFSKYVERFGLNPKSASPSMHLLAKKGLIKFVGKAPIGPAYQYEIV